MSLINKIIKTAIKTVIFYFNYTIPTTKVTKNLTGRIEAKNFDSSLASK
jgi:hypothetical protein